MHMSRASGQPEWCPDGGKTDTIAEGLAPPFAGRAAFKHIEEFVEDHGFAFSCLLLSESFWEESPLVGNKLVKIVQLCLQGAAALDRSLLFNWRGVGILGILRGNLS